MSSIRFLRTFVAVARHGSFSEAAEHVALSQAAVSLQMRALETEFGRSLFDRSGRLATLNAAGTTLLPEIQQLLALYDRIRLPRAAPGLLVGSLSMGAIVSCMSTLARVVAQLKSEHPDLSIRLVSGKSSELSHKIEMGDIDAAMVVGTGKKPPGSTWRMLYREPIRLITSAGMRDDDPLRLLRTHHFLRFDRSQHTGAQIDRMLRKMGVAPDDFLELNAIEQVLDLVRHGVGITILPLLHTRRWHDQEGLRTLSLPGALSSATRSIGMLERRGHRMQPVTEEVFRRYAHLAAEE
ncbi:LysR family transcriptional regulator [Allopusillimonas soli]|uniref:LysR family transcriptional regulator n=1 Tax=Allopusillimonas soli TaxID=659016 RepID=A0A853FF91_9BURK|nr:LysR family transcriptional regulator [Allopusillimonas soli]NYT37490.1 LysR family transcriptional regulator [Allopusillimonas soli]TEA74533.1 LysR family transcriptional regulator [Allopusillimonas soli]